MRTITTNFSRPLLRSGLKHSLVAGQQLAGKMYHHQPGVGAPGGCGTNGVKPQKSNPLKETLLGA